MGGDRRGVVPFTAAAALTAGGRQLAGSLVGVAYTRLYIVWRRTGGVGKVREELVAVAVVVVVVVVVDSGLDWTGLDRTGVRGGDRWLLAGRVEWAMSCSRSIEADGNLSIGGDALKWTDSC